MIELLKQFFSPTDKELYPPCGMFTAPHIVVATICIVFVFVLFLLTKEMKLETLNKLTLINAIIVTVLEVMKITYKFYYGYTWVDAWVPLSYCSTFIYSLWLSYFGKGVLKKGADAYIGGGAFIAGLAFILVPTTSLMDHPMFHFLSMHSMFFHSTMLYTSMLFVYKGRVHLNIKNYKYYVGYILFFVVLCYNLNMLFDSNLMIIMSPYNIPIGFINELYRVFPFGYTILIVVCYLLMYPAWMGVTHVINTKIFHQTQEELATN